MDLTQFVVNTYKNTDQIIKEVLIKPFKLNKIDKKTKQYKLDKIGKLLSYCKIFSSISLSIVIAYLSNTHYFSLNYMENIIKIFDWSTEIFVMLFGVVLTVFSITIALWGKMAVQRMAEAESGGNNYSTLEGLLISYMSLLFWSIAIVIVTFIVKTVLSPLPNYWMIEGISFNACRMLATILVFIYSFVVFSVLLEVFSLLLNLYTSTIIILYLNVKEDEKI